MLDQLWSALIGFVEPYVVPDWGSLVGLIPILLAFLVFLYVTATVFRYATAAPTRRGIRKAPPVAPPGTHMPGPSFAPPLAAFGAFMLVFGIITRGIWLWVGLLVLVITLLYWGREALRDYDRIPAAAAPTAAGALPPPAASQPPAGVHIPAPSFRPLLVAIAMTLLVAGLKLGGWALLLGFGAVVLTGLGWLRDARREYVAVEVADRTGHLDAGRAPSWPRATFAALALIIAFALLLSSGVLPNSGGGSATASGAPQASSGGGGGGGAAPSAAPSLPAADVTVTAEGIQFTTTAITIPAGKAFTLAFDNRDGVQHNIVIKDSSGSALFTGDIVTGPKVTVYNVPAIPAGTYTFVCAIHPNMTGTATAK